MASKESVKLIQELELYLTRAIEFSEFESKEKFIDEFKSIKDTISNENTNDADWSNKLESCLKIQIFFRKGMCSKWEYVPSELSKNIDLLIETSNNYLRMCYSKSGNTTYTIDASELFSIGDKVCLIQKELLILSDFGVKDYVDTVTRHIYTIKDTVDNDIANMPQYMIQSGGFSRLARHNSLEKAIS